MGRIKQHVGECSLEDISKIGQNLRDIDIFECEEASGMTAQESLLYGLNHALYIKAIFAEGEPVAAFGVTAVRGVEDCGVVWLLATKDVYKAKSTLINLGHKYVAEMLAVRPRLINLVSVDNKISIKWLERLGFIMEDPKPVGINNKEFRIFHMEV